MSKNQDKNKQEQTAKEAAEAPEIMDVVDTEENETKAEEAELDENARLQNELDAARAEIEKEKKEYLFLMADFDNFRKRMMREKSELLKNAGEKVLAGLLPIVDDFERGLAAAAAAKDADAVLQGMDLIYQKLVKYLESQGVKAMESTGADFDPELHEAIASIPAPSPELKGKVLDTTQKGYMLNDKVLRHAKVAVGE
ncbi:nucleotide exchange factor GrpE [Muribaculum intestinale]|uniref:nucleotide exchange factor GrpE n=1 Tax=Muribaculum intestinale TaxID=1796646 RepID=UPI00273045A8|nr:nucleotide exchange factor GrpE [Muribaculum intestinale]